MALKFKDRVKQAVTDHSAGWPGLVTIRNTSAARCHGIDILDEHAVAMALNPAGASPARFQ